MNRKLRIYVDFDDVICETARELSRLAAQMFGCKVAYEAIGSFDLCEAFKLNPEQYQILMHAAHLPDFLQQLAPAPMAISVLREWLETGWEPVIVTGRPPHTHPISAAWLESYGLSAIPIIFVDKYNREKSSTGNRPRALKLLELLDEKFDIAIEDAPIALNWLTTHMNCHVVVYERPWNRNYDPPVRTKICRSEGWQHLTVARLNAKLRVLEDK